MPVLRILNGEQKGAEIALEPRRYSLGSDSGCAIVISGEGVVRQHLDFVFASGGIALLRGEGRVRLDGTAVESWPQDVAPLAIVSLGGVALAYGEEDSVWPDEEDIMQALAANDDEAEMLAEDAPPLPEAGTEMEDAPARSSPWLRLAIAASMLLFFAGAGSAAYAFWLDRNTGAAAPDRAMQLAALLAEPAFAHLQLDDNGITGWTEKSSDANRILAQLRRAGVQARITSLEKLRGALDVLAGLYGTSLTYTLEARGDRLGLTLSGLVRKESAARALEQAIRRTLPAIDIITHDIMSEKQAVQRAQELMAHHPGLAQLQLAADDSGLVARGTMLGNFQQDWRDSAAAIHRALPAGLAVRNVIRTGPVFHGKVASVLIIGGSGSEHSQAVRISHRAEGGVETAAGLYRKNDVLPDNFILRAINRRKLVLEWDSVLYDYPLNTSMTPY